MRKPFIDTKFYSVLKKLQPVIAKVPFGVGELANNILTKNDSPEGVLSREKLVHSLVKMAIYAVLLYMVFSGKIDFDQANEAKDFISK